MTIFNERDPGHHEVKAMLVRSNISQYLDNFLSEGFDCLKSLCEISEDDLIALKIKRGHRRLLQREIATFKGIPREQPIWIRTTGPISAATSSTNVSPMNISDTSDAKSTSSSVPPSSNTNIKYSQKDDSGSSAHGTSSTLGGTTTSTTVRQRSSRKDSDSSTDDATPFSSLPPPPKRRYRRHPKPDPNAPAKPATAYVLFSNSIRAQLKDQNFTFAQLARITGKRWKALKNVDKQKYKTMALEAKKMYSIALEQYRRTPEYKRYQDYLKEFKLTYEPNQKRVQSGDSSESGGLADCSSNDNSMGKGSSSSGGSADGSDNDRKQKKSVGGSITATSTITVDYTAASTDDAGVRGFFQIQGDENNEEAEDEKKEEEKESWPDYIHEFVPSYPRDYRTSSAASSHVPQQSLTYDNQHRQAHDQPIALSYPFTTTSPSSSYSPATLLPSSFNSLEDPNTTTTTNTTTDGDSSLWQTQHESEGR